MLTEKWHQSCNNSPREGEWEERHCVHYVPWTPHTHTQHFYINITEIKLQPSVVKIQVGTNAILEILATICNHSLNTMHFYISLFFIQDYRKTSATFSLLLNKSALKMLFYSRGNQPTIQLQSHHLCIYWSTVHKAKKM